MTTTWSENEERNVHLFDEGLKLRDDGNLPKAQAVLEDLVRRLGRDDSRLLSHTLVQLGRIRDRLGDLAGGERFYSEATAAAPRFDLGSLGRFHALWNLNRREEALREMVRLLSLRDSRSYRELLADPEFGLDLPAPELSLVVEARRLLRGHSEQNDHEQ